MYIDNKNHRPKRRTAHENYNVELAVMLKHAFHKLQRFSFNNLVECFSIIWIIQFRVRLYTLDSCTWPFIINYYITTLLRKHS